MKQTAQQLQPSAHLGRSAFYLSISNSYPELVSVDGTLRVPMASLDTKGLIKAKDLAHNQYVQAMIHEAEDLDAHRATLNFLCKAVEKAGNTIARPHVPRARTAPNRNAVASASTVLNNAAPTGAIENGLDAKKRNPSSRKSAA